MKNRKQFREIVRAETGALDSSVIPSTLLNEYLNLALTKVQSDLMLAKKKIFIKKAYYSYPIFAEPTDMMSGNESVLALKVSANSPQPVVIATTDTETPILNITPKDPTASVEIQIVSTSGTPASQTIENASTDSKIIIKYYVGGSVSTGTMKANFEANPFTNELLTLSYPSGKTGTDTLTAQIATNTPTTDATFEPCSEVDVEDYDSLGTFLDAPDVYAPVFRRVGDASGNRVIQVAPDTVKYCELTYYYKLADITSEDGAIKVPAEVEELIIQDMAKRVYMKLGSEKVQSAITLYAERLQSIGNNNLKQEVRTNDIQRGD